MSCLNRRWAHRLTRSICKKISTKIEQVIKPEWVRAESGMSG